MSAPLSLGAAGLGCRGTIARIDTSAKTTPMPAEELERRLLEMGFVEGAAVELCHQGGLGGDPIAVRVDGMMVALRRAEAACILLLP